MVRRRPDSPSLIFAAICAVTTAIWLRVLWQAVSFIWGK